MKCLRVGDLRKALEGHEDDEPFYIALGGGEDCWTAMCHAHPVVVHDIEGWDEPTFPEPRY